MAQYYLVHAILNPNPGIVLLKILKSGYLYSSSKSGCQGLSYCPLEYVHLSLFKNNKLLFKHTINLFLSSKILYRRSFRYALTWVGSDITYTNKVDPFFDNVNNILDKINTHLLLDDPEKTHEILIKNKINLHMYLVAIYSIEQLSNEVIQLLRQDYPSVIILNEFPKTSDELNYAMINSYGK